jgi:ABC-type Mn2+/Zn2+ transport system ATPase subunit
MADERKQQDEPQDEVKTTQAGPQELSDEQLDKVSGGESLLVTLAKALGEIENKQASAMKR